MERIKLIADTACDISIEQGVKEGIEILPIPITIQGKGYYEGIDFTSEEFYKILESCREIPVTSHVLSVTFCDSFSKAYEEGCTHIICCCINGKGSATLGAARAARETFYEQHPEARSAFPIAVLDGCSYTLGYGYPILEAARRIRRGELDYRGAVDYLKECFRSMEIYFTVFTLDFARKSGRISCTAALVGGALGLRPVMSILDGEIVIAAKVRGDRNAIVQMVDLAARRPRPFEKTPYLVLRGSSPEAAQLTAQLMEERLGYPPVGIYPIGAAIAINAGPRLAAVVFQGLPREDCTNREE